MSIFPPNGKRKVKHLFKASTTEETQLWIKTINAYTDNIKWDETGQNVKGSFGSKSTPIKDKKRSKTIGSFTASTKREVIQETPVEMTRNEELFKAFHSKLFVDDCDLNVKVKALQEVRIMFKAQMEKVNELTCDIPEVKAAFSGLSNLNKAVDKLFTNILDEIDLSR